MTMRKPAMAGIFTNMFAPPLPVHEPKAKACPAKETRTSYELAGELVTNFLNDEPQSQNKQKKLWREFEDLLGKMDGHECLAALEYAHLAIQESPSHRYELFADRIASEFRLAPREPAPPIDICNEPHPAVLALSNLRIVNKFQR